MSAVHAGMPTVTVVLERDDGWSWIADTDVQRAEGGHHRQLANRLRKAVPYQSAGESHLPPTIGHGRAVTTDQIRDDSGSGYALTDPP